MWFDTLRVIACLRKFDHISDTRKVLHWLPREQSLNFKINLVCFKIDLVHMFMNLRGAFAHLNASGVFLLNFIT